MSRADRLLRMMHQFRLLAPPVLAARLAEELEVSERTIYRDIASLRAAGARIDGSAGYGYVLTEDPALPPMQFDRLEIEALLVGLAAVRRSVDTELARAGDNALAKLVARLPDAGQRQSLNAIHYVHRSRTAQVDEPHMSVIRTACWEEKVVVLSYVDAKEQASEREVYPLALVYADHALSLFAWCCLREDYREFRLDRIRDVTTTGESFRPGRVPLLGAFVERIRAFERRAGREIL